MTSNSVAPLPGLTEVAAAARLAARGANQRTRATGRSGVRVEGKTMEEPMLALRSGGGVVCRHPVSGSAAVAACRGGGCGFCQPGLIAGRVDHSAMTGFDISPGHCLLCVATPATAFELDA